MFDTDFEFHDAVRRNLICTLAEAAQLTGRPARMLELGPLARHEDEEGQLWFRVSDLHELMGWA